MKLDTIVSVRTVRFTAIILRRADVNGKMERRKSAWNALLALPILSAPSAVLSWLLVKEIPFYHKVKEILSVPKRLMGFMLGHAREVSLLDWKFE